MNLFGRKYALLVIPLLCVVRLGAQPPVLTPALSLMPPYQAATLEWSNDTQETAQAVLVQPASGGLSVIVPIVLPPKASLNQAIPLLSVSPQETYRVQLLAGPAQNARALAEAQATIAWPVDQVAPQTWIDSDQCAPYLEIAPRWPTEFRVKIAITTALFVAAVLLAGQFLPAGKQRGFLIALILVGCLSMTWLLKSRPAIEVQAIPLPTDPPQTLYVLRANRSGTVVFTPPVPAAIYPSRNALQNDSACLRLNESLEVPMRAGQVRLFRRGHSLSGLSGR